MYKYSGGNCLSQDLLPNCLNASFFFVKLKMLHKYRHAAAGAGWGFARDLETGMPASAPSGAEGPNERGQTAGGNMFEAIDQAGRALSLEERPGEPMVRTLFRAGWYAGVPLCAGLGKCGLCRVRYERDAPEPLGAELRRLSPDELAAGWRLSCLRPARSGDMVVLGVGTKRAPVTDKTPARDSERPLALGFDLGTTGLAWRAVDCGSGPERGAVAAEGQTPNPQLGAGGEVISRLAYAADPEGARHLRELVLDVIREAAKELPGRLTRLAVAGNPAMTAILLGAPLQGLFAAPYALPYRGGEERLLAEDLPPAYIPPALSPFVGGDLSAGMAHAALTLRPPYPFLLADLGTNGEFILALSPDRFLAASAPMGPALEGVGLRCGRMASPGTAVAFSLTPAGLAPRLFSEEEGGLAADAPFSAIAGTGYLSLISRLLAVGAMDRDGLFVRPGTPGAAGLSPLGARALSGLRADGPEPRLDLGGASLYASDAEEILKVKAAFNLAFSALLEHAGIVPGDLGAVILAGALGRHVNPEDLEDLGFLPSGLGARATAAGNSSLDGACLLLLSPDARDYAAALPAKTTTLDLTLRNDFQTAFAARMAFRHVF